MHPFFINQYSFSFLPLILPLALWAIFWKVYGVWVAAKNGHKKWFVALLVLNTFGILEIIYIFNVANKKWSDVRRALNSLIK